MKRNDAYHLRNKTKGTEIIIIKKKQLKWKAARETAREYKNYHIHILTQFIPLISNIVQFFVELVSKAPSGIRVCGRPCENKNIQNVWNVLYEHMLCRDNIELCFVS